MEEFYTVNQASIALKVHQLTVRRYIKEGKLKAYRAGGNIRISLNDLRSFTQSFIPHAKTIRKSQDQQIGYARKFSKDDSFFQLKGRGLSMSKLEQEQ